jgi:MYXO-CTERM domain-containing protein
MHFRRPKFNAMGRSVSLRHAFVAAALAMAPTPSIAQANSGSKDSATSEPNRIANGTAAAECAFPSIVCLGSGSCSCTGTLVTPEVILYAAHCGKISRITLGEGGGSRTVGVTKSMVHPDYNINDADNHEQIAIDWAFAVLETPVTSIPTTPPAFGCESEILVQEGGEIYQVGFGAPNSGQKYWKANTIRKLYDGVIETAGGGVGCPGDSGGPLLMRLPDKSWRTVGVTSTLMPLLEDCGKEQGYNNYSRIGREMLEWVEENSGQDITPCFTLDGVFEPTQACSNFFAGEPKDSASWSDECKDIPRVEENLNCEDDSGEDSSEGDESSENSETEETEETESSSESDDDDDGTESGDTSDDEESNDSSDTEASSDTSQGSDETSDTESESDDEDEEESDHSESETEDDDQDEDEDADTSSCACSSSGKSPASDWLAALALGTLIRLRRRPRSQG